MPVVLDQFLATLRQSGLMSEEEIEGFLAGLGDDEKPATGDDLAQLLHRRRKLTRFQIQSVYQGKIRGLVLGNYVVLDKIGQGGMGHVYKAQHRRMKRVVALKVLPSAVANSDKAVQRFQREVEAAAKLSHPHVVTAYDADQSDGVHFLVMEYVAGTDLSRLVHTQGPLSVAQAVDYVLQAAAGLAYAHAQGVIHRDIKPSNLLLDRQGTVKVLDLGLARFERDLESEPAPRSAELTQTGQLMGTIDFIAPEQAMDTRSADGRSDIYSLGCTLFYLLTGRAVYPTGTFAQKIVAHLQQSIPPLASARRRAGATRRGVPADGRQAARRATTVDGRGDRRTGVVSRRWPRVRRTRRRTRPRSTPVRLAGMRRRLRRTTHCPLSRNSGRARTYWMTGSRSNCPRCRRCCAPRRCGSRRRSAGRW